MEFIHFKEGGILKKKIGTLLKCFTNMGLFGAWMSLPQTDLEYDCFYTPPGLLFR